MIWFTCDACEAQYSSASAAASCSDEDHADDLSTRQWFAHPVPVPRPSD